MKGIKLCLSLLALFAVSSIASLALYSTDASAQAVLPTTDNLKLKSDNNEQIYDVTEKTNTSWQRIINEGNYTLVNCQPSIRDELVANLVNHPVSWRSVTQIHNKELDMYSVLIVFNNVSNSGLVLSHLGDETGFQLTASQIYVGQPYTALITVQDNGDFWLECTSTANVSGYTTFPQPGSLYFAVSAYYAPLGGNISHLYYSNFPIVENYTNQPTPTVPNQPPSQVPDNEAQPNIYMSSVQAFKGEFSDRNFFTFDGYPFLCGEFAPQISVEVWTEHGGSNEVKLDELSTSASSVFSYTFPQSDEKRDYRIVAWYSCPEYTFNNVQFYDFQIDQRGNLVGATPCSAELFCSLNFPTYGLTQVVLAPLAFLAEIPTMTCTPLTLPMPNGIGNLSLPCMTPIYQQNFGGILLLFQTIITGLFAYYVSLRIFGNIKELANPRDDQVETVRL